jgi:hypothetical protein
MYIIGKDVTKDGLVINITKLQDATAYIFSANKTYVGLTDTTV